MKISYLIFLQMIQILATYHYQLLILDNLRKSHLKAFPLIKTSQSLMEPQPRTSTVHVSEPGQKPSTNKSHDPESGIETTSEHSSSTAFCYIFNVPQPKIRNKPAQTKSSTTSDSIFTLECTTTDPDLKMSTEGNHKEISTIKKPTFSKLKTEIITQTCKYSFSKIFVIFKMYIKFLFTYIDRYPRYFSILGLFVKMYFATLYIHSPCQAWMSIFMQVYYILALRIDLPTPWSYLADHLKRNRVVCRVRGDGLCFINAVATSLEQDHNITIQISETINIILQHLTANHQDYVQFHVIPDLSSEDGVTNSDML